MLWGRLPLCPSSSASRWWSTLVVYGSGRWLAWLRQRQKGMRAVLGVCIAATTAGLAVCKYADLFTTTAQRALHALQIPVTLQAPNFLLPMGISFFTLQGISYLVDLYREKLPVERNFAYILLYLSFFPSVSSGPIARAGDMLPQYRTKRVPSYAQVKRSCLRILWGLLLKLLLADRIAPWITFIYGNPSKYAGLPVWSAVFLYGIEIYADFAGYTSMALGAAGLFGIRLPENFDLPYLSQSIREFWRRWHISFSSWLRDYVYIPLGGSRCSKKRKYGNILVTFAVSGIWHGAGWSFLAWGLLHGVYQILGDLLRPARAAVCRVLHLREGSRLRTVLCVCWTFLLVDAAWVFFRAGSASTALRIFRALFGPQTASLQTLLENQFTNGLPGFWLTFIVIGLCIVLECWKRFCGADPYASWLRRPAAVQFISVLAALLVLLIFGVYGPSYDAQSFIYAMF